MTVAQRLDALLDAGMIVEGDTTEATGGRRRRSLVFNTSQSRVLVAAVDTTHTRIAVTDLGGTVLGEDEIDAPVEARGRRRARPDRRGDGRAAGASDVTRRRTCAGRGSACPVRSTRSPGGPSQPPILPGWDAYPVAEHLQAGVPGRPCPC